MLSAHEQWLNKKKKKKNKKGEEGRAFGNKTCSGGGVRAIGEKKVIWGTAPSLGRHPEKRKGIGTERKPGSVARRAAVGGVISLKQKRKKKRGGGFSDPREKWEKRNDVQARWRSKERGAGSKKHQRGRCGTMEKGREKGSMNLTPLPELWECH